MVLPDVQFRPNGRNRLIDVHQEYEKMSSDRTIIRKSPSSSPVSRRFLALPMVAAIAVAAGCDGDQSLAQNVVGPPAVSATSPSDAAIEVATDALISVDFQQAMDPATLTSANFCHFSP